MQNYILKTNVLSDIKIPANSKISITAWFISENVPTAINLKILENNVVLRNTGKLYWNLISNPEWFDVNNEVNTLNISTIVDIYINLCVVDNLDSYIPLIMINLEDDRFVNINKEFCNLSSLEDCPNNSSQCYNHQKDLHKNFCSRYKDTNISDPPTSIELLDTDKEVETNKLQYDTEIQKKSLEYSKKIKELEDKIIQDKINLEIIKDNFKEEINKEKLISEDLSKKLAIGNSTLDNIQKELNLVKNMPKPQQFNPTSTSSNFDKNNQKKFLLFTSLFIYLFILQV